MAHIVVYCTGYKEAETIREQFAPILEEWEEPLFYREFVGDCSGFLHYIKSNPYLLILVAESGSKGLETVRQAKQINPRAGLVWFAAENYALDAFATHITYFGRLPITREKLELALDGCVVSQKSM